jgi:hypothetical protein
VRPGALLALRAEEDRELTLIALVTVALSRDHFAGDAVRPWYSCPVVMLPLGVEAILVLGVEGVVHNSPKTQKAPPTERLFLDLLS